MDHYISELCYKGTILQRNNRKMTIKWSFSCNSFVKYYGKNMAAATRMSFNQISVIIRCVINGLHCNSIWVLLFFKTFSLILSRIYP